MIPNFIVVDDDPINNMICRKIIRLVSPKADVQTFIDPGTALIYIKSTYAKANAPDAVIFLDINMPSLTGWEFLDAFELSDSMVKEHLTLYMLSSSIDPEDTDRAGLNSNVCDYIEKPLTAKWVEKVLGKILI